MELGRVLGHGRSELLLAPPHLAVLVLRELSCGVVPYREADDQLRYLVISSAVTRREHWEFPKGGVEEGETETQTALRELREETGVTAVTLDPKFREPIHYIYRRREGLISKQVVYFLGKVTDPAVTLRLEEAKDYRWATYDEARTLLRHSNARALLERCDAYIHGRPLPPRPVRTRRPPAVRSGGSMPGPGSSGPRPSGESDVPASSPPVRAGAPGAPASSEERAPGRRRRRRRRHRRRGGSPPEGTGGASS